MGRLSPSVWENAFGVSTPDVSRRGEGAPPHGIRTVTASNANLPAVTGVVSEFRDACRGQQAQDAPYAVYGQERCFNVCSVEIEMSAW